MTGSECSFTVKEGSAVLCCGSKDLATVVGVELDLVDGGKVSNCQVENSNVGVLFENEQGFKVVFKESGEISCAGPNNAPSIAALRVIFQNANGQDHGFVQGYQSWNLNKSITSSSRRHKSMSSKKLHWVTPMFKDCDHPTWTDSRYTNSTGIDSFDVILFSTDTETYLFGSTTCKVGQTGFWVYTGTKSKQLERWEMVLQFGNHSKSAESEIGEMFVCLFSDQVDSAHELLVDYGNRCKELQTPLHGNTSPLLSLGRAPVGFGSWYQFYEKVTSPDMDRMITEIVENKALDKIVDVIQLDDGFQLNTGDWLETRSRFQEADLGSVGRRIKGKGKASGLWIAPFLVSKTSVVAKLHPDWLLKNSKGKPLVGHFNFAWNRKNRPNSLIQYILDLSNPEALQHLEDTFRELTQNWDLFKIDFLAAGMREGVRFDQTQTRVEMYINGLHAIRRGAGPHAFILGCGAPMMASAQSGVCDAMRVTCDTVEAWRAPLFARTFMSDWENAPSCEVSMWSNITRYYMHKTLFPFSDPDCMVLRDKGSSLSYQEVLTQLSVLGLTGGLLFFTDDMEHLDPKRLDLALRVLPGSSLLAKPVGLIKYERPTAFVVDGVTHGVEAKLNWSNKSKKSVLCYEYGGFEFWSGTVVKAGVETTFTHGSHGTCLIQYPTKPCCVIGCTLNLTALADGRISVEENDGKCIVKGDEKSICMSSGVIVFSSDVWEVDNAQGVEAEWDIKDKQKLKVEITSDTTWSIELVTKTAT